MGCIDEMDYEILKPNCGFLEAAEFIKKNFKEIYYVNPGYRIFDTFLIGRPPIPLGIDGDHVILPFTKPCHGTFVLKIAGKSEIEGLRKSKERV